MMLSALFFLTLGTPAPDAASPPPPPPPAATVAPPPGAPVASALSTLADRHGTRLMELETELAYVRGGKGSLRISVVRLVDETHSQRLQGLRILSTRAGCSKTAYVDQADIPELLSALRWLKTPPRLATFSEGERWVVLKDELVLETSYGSTPSSPYHVGVGNCAARLSARQATALRQALLQGQDFLAAAR